MLPSSSIARDSPIPFYFQLAELLEHEIQSGRWAPGLRLPSELELCTHFGVSRTTVRQALGRLEQEGLISRRKGQGTFVEGSRPRSWLLQSSAGFFQEEVERQGKHVTSRIRRAEQGPLPRWASDALGLEAGSVGVTLERVRSIDGLVAMYNVNHLPERFAEAVLSLGEDESLYQRLHEVHGIKPGGGRRVLEAVAAEEPLAKLLEVEPRAPLVFIESVAWEESLQPFDCYEAWLRTDRMKIDVQVVAAPPAAALAAERIWQAAT